MKILDRIKKGAALLDKKYGKRKWRKKVDLESLDMGSCSSCLLGQTDSDYFEHLEELALDDQGAYELGFSIFTASALEANANFRNSEKARVWAAKWTGLTKAWKAFLTTK